MADNFDEKLKTMEENWAEGKDTPPGPPDGSYAMQLQECELRESQQGKLYILRTHLVIDGEYEGEVVRDMMSLETERGPYFISRWIDQMGYQSPESASDIPETLEAIANDNPTYTGQIKHSGDFINVRIQELLEQKAAKPEKPLADKVESGEESIPIGTTVKFDDSEVGEVTGTISNNDDPADYEIDVDGELWGCPLAELEVVEDDPPPGEDPEDELVVALIALGQACGINEISEDDDLKTLKKKLSEYEWAEDELVDDELKALKDAGIKVKKGKKK